MLVEFLNTDIFFKFSGCLIFSIIFNIRKFIFNLHGVGLFFSHSADKKLLTMLSVLRILLRKPLFSWFD